MDSTVADPLIGRLLDGRYRVGRRIARGGMATVYEATDLRLDRVCALKVMHPGLGDDHDFAARFVREARSAARLSHPNVVAVFDQGDDDGTLFLAMEYVPGRTLRDLVRDEAPMPPARALALLDPVLSALAAAHHAGLIHRDVKPENVLLADDGRIKVADFGLARAVSGETQHTGTSGVLIGTVSYLSPELVVDGTADARSDVYAAGVLLHELLTGRKPHEGDSPIQVAYKHVHEDVPPPSRSASGIPAYVDALVARATARDRHLRPADAQVLLHQVRRVRAALDHGVTDDPELTEDLAPGTATVTEDLEHLRTDSPTILPPERAGGREDTSVLARRGASPPDGPGGQAGGRTSAPRRKRRGPLVLALLLVLAVVAGLAGWWFGLGRYRPTPAVIDLTTAQARHKVQADGLAFRIGSRHYSETVAAGHVISTDPNAGSKILSGATVTAVVSRGPERHAVPVLRGRSLDAAQKALRAAHLSFGRARYRYDEQVARGVVLSSDPPAQQMLKRGTPVDLVVSKGPRPIPVPDLSGQAVGKAERQLTKLHLTVHLTWQHSDSVAKGQVVSQSPSTGTLFRGQTVDLVGSRGPVMVTVPHVKGMGVQDATAALQAAGFKVTTAKSQLYVGLGYVVSSDPGAGAKAPRGSVVTLYLV